MTLPRDPTLEEYLGSKHSALGFGLFALGLAALLGYGLVAAQFAGSEELAEWNDVAWLMPLWGIVAIPLGIFLRRKDPRLLAIVAGSIWLAIPLGLALILRF